MKSVIWYFCPIILLTVLFDSGCQTSYTTTKRSEILALNGQGPIRALTVDSLLYTFDTFSFDDSTISGRGTLKRNGEKTPFDGFVPFRKIVFIERLENSGWKAAWVIPACILVASGTFSALSERSSVEIHRPSGGGSCPYIYSFDGTEFKRDAEAFGTSISKALEGETFSVLPSLTAVDGNLTVRVSNERPETHMINRIQLFAADAGTAQSVVIDNNNNCLPVFHPISPRSAHDQSGKNILNEITTRDLHYWRSDMQNTTAFSGFRDQVEAEFDLPANASSATIIIDAINSDLITDVYSTVGGLLGDATLEFYNALEHDTQLQSDMREWINDCKLKIEIGDGDQWKDAGTILPEATLVPFTRAIRIDNITALQRPLRVRLSSLTDVWRLNAVAVDYSPVRPLPMVELPMTSDLTQKLRDALASDDSSYATLLPPDQFDARFDAAPTTDMQHPVYIFAAKGYLYEWFPKQESPKFSFAADAVTGYDRVAMLKLLIKDKNIFLPPIYAEWRKHRENDSMK